MHPDMGWTISGSQPDCARSASRFFSALGRGMYLATEFERKCDHLLMLGTMVRRVEDSRDGTLDAEALFAPVLNDRAPLGPVLTALKALGKVKPGDLQVLDKGRSARNYLAHRAGELGRYEALRPRRLTTATNRLRSHVEQLAIADGLVSEWLYCIETKDTHGPAWLTDSYATAATDWVMTGRSRRFVDARKRYELDLWSKLAMRRR